MGVEIERKFLVANDGWRDSVISSHDLLDGVVARSGGRKVRVRVSADRAWIAIKGERNGLSRAEFEYEIPHSDAEALLELCSEPPIRKTRHWVAEAARSGRSTFTAACSKDSPSPRSSWRTRLSR